MFSIVASTPNFSIIIRAFNELPVFLTLNCLPFCLNYKTIKVDEVRQDSPHLFQMPHIKFLEGRQSSNDQLFGRLACWMVKEEMN